MRKKVRGIQNEYSIIVVDDDPGIIDSTSIVLKRIGYDCVGYTDPAEAIEAIRNGSYDLLILDYFMGKTRGDEFVSKVREFNKTLYILLLTGHKDLAPPLKTLRTLDIQGYCEKSNKFDQLIMLVESGLKSVSQLKSVQDSHEDAYETYEQLESQYLELIEFLRQSVETKDKYKKNHSDKVALYSVKIGESFDLNKKELEMLRVAGIFHDIGEISISDDILMKPSSLTRDEYEEIKKHPLIGVKIILPLNVFNDIIPIVKHHHERIDGTGYPKGLKGVDIPFLARIISVADAYVAMTSDRPYRECLTHEAARQQLIEGSGTQFDSRVVDVFLELLED